MARITLASLQATIESLRSELATQRVINQQLTSQLEASREISARLMQRCEEEQRKPAAPAKPAFVRRPDPRAAEREAYRAYVAAQRERARTEQRAVTVPCFDAWLAAH